MNWATRCSSARESDELMNCSTTVRERGSKSVRACIAFMRSARAASVLVRSACFIRSFVAEAEFGCVSARRALPSGIGVAATRPALVRKPPEASHGIGMPLP